MTARETLVPVLLEKVYQLIQDKLDLAHQPLVTQLAQHLFSNISNDDLTERNESDLYGAVVSLWHHINEKKSRRTFGTCLQPNSKPPRLAINSYNC